MISGITQSQQVQDDSFWTKAKKYANKLIDGIFGSTSSSSKEANPHEISIMKEPADVATQTKNNRAQFINTRQNGNYTVKAGDNLSKIAEKFGVQAISIQAENGLNEKSVLKLGQVLKMPPTRTPQNIDSLDDVAKAMGVSKDFILKLKRLEDGHDKSDNEFYTYVYDDATGEKSDGENVKGTETIGIGHVWKKGEPRTLTKQQVLEFFAKDLIKMEDHLKVVLGGAENYDRLPPSIKEALLDMTFNKGTDILKNTEGLLWCLKNERYEAAICKMTDNRSAKTKEERSGLSKRRLFDMATASKMYNGKVPQSISNKIQEVYNNGIKLLRQEYPNKNDFKAMLVGFNDDVQVHWGNKIKYIKQ